ncbi:uncharacterized protein LOC131157653 isoform X2 [Malania oleifera]|uniref:uncharacterized protein LOC131157653 isoform X2 n=1 Tax=Malania oleifera TaxID=397392 RepID=UPI0025AEB1C2|nr:uncharacterized protein LOC131157653 isoform X2 [Malania oleifera]
MKIKGLAIWLLFMIILWSQSLLSVLAAAAAAANPLTFKDKEMHAGGNATIGFGGEIGDERKEEVLMNPIKAKRGPNKGGNGGVNLIHRPPKGQKSAALPLLPRPYASFFFFFSISTLACVGSVLLLAFPF